MNTGTTTINGYSGRNIGVSPGNTFTGQANVLTNGAVHLNDVVATNAQIDLSAAYTEIAGRTGAVTIPSELGGTTLKPGIYVSESGTFTLNGVLTLDALSDLDGVFIFRTTTTLITSADSRVNLISNNPFYRTFWQVGSSATLGENSVFVGHIFALDSITTNHHATVQGQLFAMNGSVILNSTTIRNGIYPAILHVINHVINDNGRSAVAADFKLHVITLDNDFVGSPASGVESPGTTYTLPAGNYVINEDTFPGYTVSYSGDSGTSGNITLISGDNKTITITNNDN